MSAHLLEYFSILYVDVHPNERLTVENMHRSFAKSTRLVWTACNFANSTDPSRFGYGE